MLQFLNANSLTALGWALLNSIWQMGILWLLYLLLTANNKRYSAAIRHNLAAILSVSGFAWFLYFLISSLISPGGFMEWNPVSALSTYISSAAAPFLSALSVIYLAILAFQAFRYMLGFHQIQVKRKCAGQLFSEPLQLFSDRISTAMGIQKPVNILLVNWVDTAQTIGFIKPLVLLPVALLNRLTMEQAEAILLHELEHIRRNDYIINILMTIFRTIFFFNPFAVFFFKTVAGERENACDDGVLHWNYSAPVYAEALLSLEKFRQMPPTLSIAADGNNPRLLMERIRRLVGLPVSGRNPFSPLLSFSLIAALFIFTLNSFSHFPKPDSGSQPPTGTAFQKKTISIRADGQEAGTATIREIQVRVEYKRGKIKNDPVTRKLKPPPPPAVSIPAPVDAPPALLTQTNEGTVKDHLQYADQIEVRNFSNEKAADPETPVVADQVGIPYIPSTSFSFSPGGNTMIYDSLEQTRINALLALNKIETVELKSKLNLEINRILNDLRQMELKNQQLTELRGKESGQALRKIRMDIQRKKEDINKLKIQLRIQSGEVIVI